MQYILFVLIEDDDKSGYVSYAIVAVTCGWMAEELRPCPAAVRRSEYGDT